MCGPKETKPLRIVLDTNVLFKDRYLDGDALLAVVLCLVVSMVAGAGTYILMLLLFRVEEIGQLIRAMRRRFMPIRHS